GMKETFGEVDPALKHRVSHRAKAFEKFRAWLKAQT
ncbi:MAG: non-canonical purine NTP pyrophosphatase, partial [Alphaproteobacteria bacterium]|nr:non-canonical purine NTP pyrophosphatase [Alphaproteobacteria bacterium]